MHFLGIDIGTQSLKAVITDGALRPLGSGNASYEPSYPRPGWAEQHPDVWLEALGPAIAAALAAARLGPEAVTAMAICGQLDGCIAADSAGRALGPALLWMDRRAQPAIFDIDPALVSARAGLVLDGTHMAAKIRWHRQQDREAAVAVWHQPVSFMLEALTGSRVMDHCLASTTMLYGLASQRWDEALLSLFGVAAESLPKIADAASTAGQLSARGAALTGLPAGLPVAVGTGDDFSNPIGCGIAAPGIVAVTLGTAEVVGGLAPSPLIDPQMLVETRAFPGGNFLVGNPGWMSGGALRWFCTVFSVGSAAELCALAAAAPAGCDGLLFIPALSGAMAPRWVPEARGVFHGISAAHEKAHFARAVLEGTAFAMRDVIDRLDAMGVETGLIRVMGGGAASEVWMQIRADLSGRPLDAITGGDASALGAAVIAAVAGTACEDINQASRSLRLGLRRTEPEPMRRSVYDDAYGRYRQLFDRLEPPRGSDQYRASISGPA